MNKPYFATIWNSVSIINYARDELVIYGFWKNGEVGCAIIAQGVKIAFQPLLSSIRAN